MRRPAVVGGGRAPFFRNRKREKLHYAVARTRARASDNDAPGLHRAINLEKDGSFRAFDAPGPPVLRQSLRASSSCRTCRGRSWLRWVSTSRGSRTRRPADSSRRPLSTNNGPSGCSRTRSRKWGAVVGPVPIAVRSVACRQRRRSGSRDGRAGAPHVGHAAPTHRTSSTTALRPSERRDTVMRLRAVRRPPATLDPLASLRRSARGRLGANAAFGA
jgi:hypothetical protein